MQIEIVKRLIAEYAPGHAEFVKQFIVADRYYRNDTDILYKVPKKEEEGENPLRNADNRIPFNFHGLLVNQKASYLFTAPPVFDIGSDSANKALVAFLGDKYPKVCKDLCIQAANATVGWIHVWRDPVQGYYKYAVVPSAQIIPIWDMSLDRRLLGVLRCYPDVDEETGDHYTVYEYWTDTECEAYMVRQDEEVQLGLMPRNMFSLPTGEPTNQMAHDIGEVPFFCFNNNNVGTSDLDNIKRLIDTYCDVFSGFANDLEDIQEVIFVLTNYGGQDLKEFLTDMKYYKTIKVDNDGDGDNSGVSTLTIDIPVEAREKLLEVTRKCIFEQGMGIDPDPENFGNSSGVALKFLYSLLELKSGLTETEFRPSFGRFIRCICRINNIPIKDDTIGQTWTRTAVTNDQEQAQIAAQSMNVISKETVVRNHPWVDDAAAEMERIEEETQEALDREYEFMNGDVNGKEDQNKETE